MDWYEPYSLSESTRKIRKFLIEVASLEQQIKMHGLIAVERVENFESTVEALDEFPEKFASIKRKMSLLDKELFHQLDLLEKDGKLVDQLSLINLKIQLASKASHHIPSTSSLFEVLFSLPKLFSRMEKNEMFDDESISLKKAIVSCDRLISTLKIAEEILRYREESDDAFFKPSNVKQSRVSELIDKTIGEIEEMATISIDAKTKLIGYLQEAKTEAASSQPQWSKIVGALVIAAAITSGLADAPAAAKTLQSTIEYILGSSVAQPLHRYLPPPEPTRGPAQESWTNQA